MKIEQIFPKKEEFFDLITDKNVFVVRMTNRKEYTNLDEQKRPTHVYDGMGFARLAKTKIEDLLAALDDPKRAIVRITHADEIVFRHKLSGETIDIASRNEGTR
jgi:hypothetical protein